MKILFLPKYSPKAASSRYRTYQYLPYFTSHDLDIQPLFDEAYVPDAYRDGKQSKWYIVKRYFQRAKVLLFSPSKDIIFLEKEFFPYTPYLGIIFRLLNIKYIVDYDDAIFHLYDQHPNSWIRKGLQNKISNVIKNAAVVVTGSPYLSSYCKKFNYKVIEIPTSIDYEKYQSARSVKTKRGPLIIGWIGSKTTSKNLIPLLSVFTNLDNKGFKYELRLIGFDKSLEPKLEGINVKFIEWQADKEVEEINKFDVGIMPLDDNHFNRGKCAFKLIQYMACGVLTISTPFEANIKVDGGNGNLFAGNTNQWLEQIYAVANMEVEAYEEICKKNRTRIKDHYSIQANHKKLLAIFEEVHSIRTS